MTADEPLPVVPTSRAPSTAPRLEPYRLLFPIGVTLGAIGGGAWPLHALGLLPYPGALHRALMIQGFELGFVMGFLLTAMPAFTHGPKCHPAELAAALTALLGFAAATLLGAPTMAAISFLVALSVLAFAGLRRVAHAPGRPPAEFLFVAFGLLAGLAGGALQLAEALGASTPLPPRFAERLISLGMVLSMVVGVGSLLVPTFAGMRAPLVIPGVAGPHERRGRMLLYAAVMATIAMAFVLEAARQDRLGMALRALAATLMVIWVWKLYRLPRRDVPGFTLWTAGWFVPAGLWAAAIAPAQATGWLHLTFVGGFALLTFGIGTRVMVSHGRHPLDRERRVLTPGWGAVLLAGLALRIAAELAPAHAIRTWGAAGALWAAAAGWWWLRVSSLGRMTGKARPAPRVDAL